MAMAIVRSGKGATSSTAMVARLGNHGAYPNNVERDLHKLMKRKVHLLKPKITMMTLTVVDVKAMGKLKRQSKQRTKTERRQAS